MTHYPLNDFRLTDEFGKRFIDGAWQMHAGQDFANNDGTPIHAVKDGIVRFAGWNDTYGWCVKISHGEYETLYAHMNSSPNVVIGQHVNAGDIIGYVGDTGYSKGNHLHFAVFDGPFIFGNISNAVEPMEWLANNTQEVEEDFMATMTDDEKAELMTFVREWNARSDEYPEGYSKSQVLISHTNQVFHALIDGDPNAYEGKYRRIDIIYSHVNQIFDAVNWIKNLLDKIKDKINPN